jgi:lipoprotein NlpD
MTSGINKKGIFAVLVAALLAGCSSGAVRAPITDAAEKKPAVKKVEPVVTDIQTKKVAQPEKDWRPQVYVVQKGDTLYGIAFNHGLDYHELIEINSIQNPDVIQAGQELRLFKAVPGAVAETPKVKTVEIKQPVIPVKDQPKVAILPYSDQAVVEIQKLQEVVRKPEPVVVAKIEPKPEPKPELKPKLEVATEPVPSDDSVEWGMPTLGKVIAEFSESDNRKGIDITGIKGQNIVASAAGKVVYSGNGLRGYGKLIIIKHNNTYLSAYAHNDQVLVKEGQTVTKGQKIAEMGNTDSDQVKLHFEIRKLGKPVDPSKYLTYSRP